MAVIADSNLRHVRKTLTFDGTAVGDVGTDTIFTTTGRVRVQSFLVYVSTSVTEGGGAAATAKIGIPSADSLFRGVLANPADLVVGSFWGTNSGFSEGVVTGYALDYPITANALVAIAEDIILTVGTDVLNGGVLVIDCWYLPVTDDGALAGDDIDSGYTPVDVKAISGDTTAADRLEALQDGIVLGIVGASSTTTSIANCTGFTEATNDHFNGRLITFLTGNLAGQQCAITDYAGAAQTFTCAALTEAPAASDTFVIH